MDNVRGGTLRPCSKKAVSVDTVVNIPHGPEGWGVGLSEHSPKLESVDRGLPLLRNPSYSSQTKIV